MQTVLPSLAILGYLKSSFTEWQYQQALRKTKYSVVIVGGGFAGLCSAVKLKEAGISFTLFEKCPAAGGTWLENIYPGSGCDIPIHLYSFSFALKTDWSRKWVGQKEIKGYIDALVEKHELKGHMQFRSKVIRAEFNEQTQQWSVVVERLSEQGTSLEPPQTETVTTTFLVNATGQLNVPKLPEIKDIDKFKGEWFHSARWPLLSPVKDKNVALVGTGPSAVQIIPEIAKEAKQLSVFFRSPAFVVSKDDYAYPDALKRVFTMAPITAKMHRWYLFGYADILAFPSIYPDSYLNSYVEGWTRDYMNSQIRDPTLLDVLIPKHSAITSKRILISSDYLAALQRPNVKVITDKIMRIEEEGVVVENKEKIETLHKFDVIVYATGFETRTFIHMDVIGKGGKLLKDEWTPHPHAYYGITVPDFPNLFLLYGPNTNLGHNSILWMLECQVNYILQCIKATTLRKATSLTVKREVFDAWYREIQASLSKTGWADPSIQNWYKAEDGVVVNNWPHRCLYYWWKTRRLRESDYEFHIPASL